MRVRVFWLLARPAFMWARSSAEGALATGAAIHRGGARRRRAAEPGAAGHELAGEDDLVAAGGHHAQLSPRLVLDARERAQGGELDTEAAVQLLRLRARGAKGVEPVREPHLVGFEADHAEEAGHEHRSQGRRHAHRAQAMPVTLAVEARAFLP